MCQGAIFSAVVSFHRTHTLERTSTPNYAKDTWNLIWKGLVPRELFLGIMDDTCESQRNIYSPEMKFLVQITLSFTEDVCHVFSLAMEFVQPDHRCKYRRNH